MDEAAAGTKALQASDASAALGHFTRALLKSPRAVDYWINRSTAFSRVKDRRPEDLESALHDADIAVKLSQERGQFEKIQQAQFRRAVSLFNLGRYGDADLLFKHLQARVKKQEESKGSIRNAQTYLANIPTQRQPLLPGLDIWELKAATSLGNLGPDAEQAKVTITDKPDIEIPEDEKMRVILKAQLSEKGVKSALVASESGHETNKMESMFENKPSSQESPLPVPQSSKPIKLGGYENGRKVTIVIYVENVQKESVRLTVQEKSLSIDLPTASGSLVSGKIEPLLDIVVPSESSIRVTKKLVEISLSKKDAGRRWDTFLRDVPFTSDTSQPVARSETPLIHSPNNSSYPTSSKKGIKDWDKVAASLSKKRSTKPADDNQTKGEEHNHNNENGGQESDADEEYGADPVDSFFKKLYAKADPDTRRAMMKSFSESQGTALSTNWSEVKKGKVEAKPPSD